MTYVGIIVRIKGKRDMSAHITIGKYHFIMPSDPVIIGVFQGIVRVVQICDVGPIVRIQCNGGEFSHIPLGIHNFFLPLHPVIIGISKLVLTPIIITYMGAVVGIDRYRIIITH